MPIPDYTVHEIAHLVARKVRSQHQTSWSRVEHTFQQLMVPYIRPEIFPNQLLPLLARHLGTPAPVAIRYYLSPALKQFDAKTIKLRIEIPYGQCI
jgi:hypothetical protein